MAIHSACANSPPAQAIELVAQPLVNIQSSPLKPGARRANRIKQPVEQHGLVGPIPGVTPRRLAILVNHLGATSMYAPKFYSYLGDEIKYLNGRRDS